MSEVIDEHRSGRARCCWTGCRTEDRAGCAAPGQVRAAGCSPCPSPSRLPGLLLLSRGSAVFSGGAAHVSLTNSPVTVNPGGLDLSSAVCVAGLHAGEAASSANISVCKRPLQITETGGQKQEGQHFSLHASSVSSRWWFVALWALRKTPHYFLKLYFWFAKT